MCVVCLRLWSVSVCIHAGWLVLVCVSTVVAAGFNTTQKLFDAVQGALRLEFVVDQGANFNGYLAAHAQVPRL